MEYKFNFRTRVSLWLTVLLIALAFGGGVFAGGTNVFSPGQNGLIKGATNTPTSTATSTGLVVNGTEDLPDYLKKDVDFSLFWEVWGIVKNNYYVNNVPDTQLFYGALNGIVNSLDDPYSVFFTPQDNGAFQQDLQGNFEGIGAEIAVKSGNLIVISPLPDSPAFKAGLKPNDYILKINGTSTEKMNVNEAVALIRGPKDSSVVLSVFRPEFTEPKDITIIRDAINVKSVSTEYKGDIAYIKVRQFNDDTLPLFDQAVNDLKSKNAKAIIVDLRNNPGGYLQSAVDMVGVWMGNQTAVVEKRKDGTQITHTSNRTATLADVPTVLLVDEGSASASEIVAGALQDYGKAILVGAKTFGKGSVQDLITLSNGSAVKITVAQWFTPKDRTIDKTGIEPDVKVELTEEDFNTGKDPQLDKALEILNKK